MVFRSAYEAGRHGHHRKNRLVHSEAIPVPSGLEVANECLLESIRSIPRHQLAAIRFNVDGFQAHAQGLEKAGKLSLAGNLDVVKTGAVGQQHTALGDALQDVGNAAPNGHGLTFFVQTICPHHAPFGHDDHHGVRLHGGKDLFPGVVMPAGDGYDVPGHHTEKEPHQGPSDGLVGYGHEPLESDAVDEFVGKPAYEKRFIQAGMVEEGHQPEVSPWFGRRRMHPLDIEPVEDPGDSFNASQHGIDALFPHDILSTEPL